MMEASKELYRRELLKGSTETLATLTGCASKAFKTTMVRSQESHDPVSFTVIGMAKDDSLGNIRIHWTREMRLGLGCNVDWPQRKFNNTRHFFETHFRLA